MPMAAFWFSNSKTNGMGMSTGKLFGKVAVITGAASGIGQATALRFAQEGAQLMLADINPCDETHSMIKEIGGLAIQQRVDTTSDDDCNAMIAQTIKEFGRVDTGVFSAGIRYSGVAITDLEISEFQRVFDINMTGVLRCAQALVRQLLTQGEGGTIVNIASTAGTSPLARSGTYCISKAGVIMLTKVMALELAETGIRVNALAPGFTETPMYNPEKGSPADERAMAMTPMKRLGTPQEQAEACLFLASSDSSYMTGQTLYNAGGQFVG